MTEKLTLDVDFTGSKTSPLFVPTDDAKHPNRKTGALFVPSQVRPASDGLHLVADRVRNLAGQVTTAGKFAQTYGRFEVTAEITSLAMPGFQSTLWLWPVDVLAYGSIWPDSGEIDFAEFYTRLPLTVVPTIHYPLATISSRQNQYQAGKTFVSGEHVFGCVWAPGIINCTLDGQTYLTCNYVPSTVRAPAPFDKPFFLAMTQTIGQNTPHILNGPRTATPATCETIIKRVQAWQ